MANRYRKGANLERKVVNEHIEAGAIFAMRGAGSKCRGKLKVDVVALYPDKGKGYGTLLLEQYKKSKSSYKKEKKSFLRIKTPEVVKLVKNFIQVK